MGLGIVTVTVWARKVIVIIIAAAAESFQSIHVVIIIQWNEAVAIAILCPFASGAWAIASIPPTPTTCATADAVEEIRYFGAALC